MIESDRNLLVFIQGESIELVDGGVDVRLALQVEGLSNVIWICERVVYDLLMHIRFGCVFDCSIRSHLYKSVKILKMMPPCFRNLKDKLRKSF